MRKMIFGFMLIIGTISVSSLSASKEKSVRNDHLFLLPVDVTSPNKRICNLSVSIAEDYKSLQQELSESCPIIEFIPKKETVNNFSEIITVQPIIGRKISAHILSRNLVKEMKKKFKVDVLKQEVADKKHPAKRTIVKMNPDKTAREIKYVFDNQFQTSKYIIAYEVDGQREILGYKYVSGPYDCAGVQYTIKLKKGSSEDAAVKKINIFLNNNAYLLEVLK